MPDTESADYMRGYAAGAAEKELRADEAFRAGVSAADEWVRWSGEAFDAGCPLTDIEKEYDSFVKGNLEALSAASQIKGGEGLMGWEFGVDANGREVGYGVEATCDLGGCDYKIDRGVGYRCGGDSASPDESGCGGFFCDEHLSYFWRPPDENDEEEMSVALCDKCGRRWEADLDDTKNATPSQPDRRSEQR